MRRAFSFLKGSKKSDKDTPSKSDNIPTAKAEEAPPAYTASAEASKAKTDGGNVKVKTPKGCGCAIVSKKVATANSPEDSSDSGPSTLTPPRFPVFAFGPDGYFLSVPTVDEKTAMAYAVYAPVQSFIMTKRDEFSEIYWYAFTPYSDEIIAYKDKSSGLVMWTFFKYHKRPANAPSYSSLLRWLRENVEHNVAALQKSWVVFGPNGSYFARSATACTWHDIPDNIQDRMDKLFPDVALSDRPIPDFVALGADGAFIVWPAGVEGESRITTNLPDDHFLRKHKALSRAEGMEWVALSVDHKKNCFHSNQDGEVMLLFEDLSQKSALNIFGQVTRWMQLKAIIDKSTFDVSFLVGEVVEKFKISHDTEWTGVEFVKR